jgi:dihydrofolate reductase
MIYPAGQSLNHLKESCKMRKIIAANHVTLDGVIQSGGGPEEDPTGGFTLGGWQVPFRSPEGGKSVLDFMSREFDLLLGRRTYEIFAAFWPAYNDNPVGQAINKAKKYVATNTLDRFDWENTHRLSGDAVDAVRDLKESDGPEVHMWGSSRLLQSLMAAQLVDEFLIWIYPVVLGKRLFEAGVPPFGLSVVESHSTPSGIVVNTYRLAGPVRTGFPQPGNPSEAELARRRKLAAEEK